MRNVPLSYFLKSNELLLSRAGHLFLAIRKESFPAVLVVKNTPANAGDLKDAGLISGSGSSPGGGNGNPLQRIHGQRSLVGYSPRGCTESQSRTERLSSSSIRGKLPTKDNVPSLWPRCQLYGLCSSHGPLLCWQSPDFAIQGQPLGA